MGIKIITDSACDLTKEYIESENIGLVSLILNLNGKLGSPKRIRVAC
ncbi:MAG: DegV family protein [Clostridium sp.]